jgi:hypothetical protein
MDKPKLKSSVEKELDQVKEQFDHFDNSIKEMTMDRMNEAPKLEMEPQTKLSQNEISKSKDIYLKPLKFVGDPNPFNEKYRDDYNFQKEYVQFIAENKELIGENIEKWTKPFRGVPAEFWNIPTNKPVWGPRYLAESLKSKFYHRFVMSNAPVEQSGVGTIYGAMAVDTIIQRLDATPVNSRKSIFMGAQ